MKDHPENDQADVNTSNLMTQSWAIMDRLESNKTRTEREQLWMKRRQLIQTVLQAVLVVLLLLVLLALLRVEELLANMHGGR